MSNAAHDPLMNLSLRKVDPELDAIFVKEAVRQRDHIELIASENYTYAAVREAQGSILTNKYAEGLPGKRYYAGCEFVDEAENLARNRALQLFVGSEHVNVQPHSGASANIATFTAAMSPGDSFVAMSLDQGGHLSHGASVNISGKWFKPTFYGVRAEDGLVDWDAVQRAVDEAKPKVVIAGASAYPRSLDFEKFAAIAHAAGAKLMVDMAHISGVVAAGLHPSPFPHADYVTTTTHKTLRGPRGGMIFARADEAAAIDRAVFPGNQGGPLMHVIAAKAVAYKLALQPEFRAYMQRTLDNAQALAAALAARGFGVITGGTDNHLMLVDLRARSVAENLFLDILHKIADLTEKMGRIPSDLEGLKLSLADIYYGNFSLFQSLPDTWAIDQLFPIAPIHRLNEEPTRRAVIADITCDSDGKIDRFVGEEEVVKVLPLHEMRNNEEYYLGVFLVGAYQETLGDLHNLFGDTNVVSVRINRDGGYDFVKEIQGDTISDVLSYVEYYPKEMQEKHRNTAERAVREGRITARERQWIIKLFNESLNGYTYFEKED